MRKKDNVICDPFRGYPQPPPSSWLRIALWAFLGVVLAVLVLAKYWR